MNENYEKDFEYYKKEIDRQFLIENLVGLIVRLVLIGLVIGLVYWMSR